MKASGRLIRQSIFLAALAYQAVEQFKNKGSLNLPKGISLYVHLATCFSLTLGM
ncbi:hypothetical protein [Caldalkalibacillus mannanilyticus]|uniref:hypothetical protein n=1 Tax=Caldalkalibacillus mannanilyticus TaxID=1418 RepID=UPI00131F480A|nr:hypothetical protein [Caldalkalibacillus mannanilyticus]